VLWLDGKLPLYQREVLPQLFEERVAADLAEYIEHILHDGIANSDELAARLRLIGAARTLLVAVGFTVSMDRKTLFIEDDEGGDA
jgi:hypothetical protein